MPEFIYLPLLATNKEDEALREMGIEPKSEKEYKYGFVRKKDIVGLIPYDEKNQYMIELSNGSAVVTNANIKEVLRLIDPLPEAPILPEAPPKKKHF